MNIHITPLYRPVHLRVPRHIIAIIAFISLFVPLNALGTDPLAPYEQEFVITAYYSPLPGQCCYIKGGYVADKILNGDGHTAADGTGVYPGMLAAPSAYAFGTRIALPGIGTLTVHDRGGAIKVLGSGKHRLDIWAGYGEEGLARALAFGVQRVKGMVYLVGANQPAHEFALESLQAPLNRLEPFLVSGRLLAVTPKREDRSLSAKFLQEYLRDAGYFKEAVTGYFGPETERSLSAFNRDFQLNESSDQLSGRTAAFLVAAVRRKDALLPISAFVDADSKEYVIKEAQRTLRFLGYYDGRTSGKYNDQLAGSILRFQQEHGLVGTAEDPGAGRIGPLTTEKVERKWNRKLVAHLADVLLTLARVEQTMGERGTILDSYLAEGNGGSRVRLLQELLAERGFFPAEKINGYFGPLTKESVTHYQLATDIIKSPRDEGAGYVGPATMNQLRREQRLKAFQMVRGQGWGVL